MFLRSIPPKHVKMMILLMQLSEKRLVLRPIWQKCSTIHLQSREILAGLTVACPHLFAWQNLKTVHFPPLEPSNTWKKKVPKKICRLKFRFLCLDRKSWVSWSHFLDSKPFAALSFLAYAWFPKRHFIMVDSAKTRRKWWFYSFNSAKKGGVWAQFGRNALQYISNRGNLLGGLLLLVHIYSNGKNLKKTDQQKVSCISL